MRKRSDVRVGWGKVDTKMEMRRVRGIGDSNSIDNMDCDRAWNDMVREWREEETKYRQG